MASVIPIRAATFVYPELHPEGPGRDTIFVFVVRSVAGTFLVDTGIGSGNAQIDHYYRPDRVDLPSALRAAGADPAKLTAIVCSHLHFDHCGNNRLFPGVPIYVQRKEMDAARGEDYTVPEWLEFDGADYRLLDGDTRLAADVEVRFTPGHTPGHQSIIVRGPAGNDLVVAQAAQTAAAFAAFDPAASVIGVESRSLALLHSLKPDRAWFSHGEDFWTPEGLRPVSSVAAM